MSNRASAGAGLIRPEGMREFVRLAAEALVVGVLASVVLLVAALFIAQAANAAAPASPTTGTLLLKGEDGSVA